VVSSKIDFLRRMHKEHGLEAVTIANPIYIIEVKRACPDLEIHASVLGDIDCMQRAIMYAEVGADVITPDANINRNLGLLKEIKKATKTELKLMVNEGCLYKCPFRKFHFNYISHSSKELHTDAEDPFFNNCISKTLSDPPQIFKSGWIRPEDIEKYCGITTFFKIVGRAGVPSFIERATKAYLEQSWDGDLLDIISSSMHQFGLHNCAYVDNKSLDKHDFFQKIISCDCNCSNCNYCRSLVEKVIHFNMITKGKLEDVNLKEIADQMEKKGKKTLPWTEELAESIKRLH
jgi:collagenase-like PrtC family protease